uniref:HhH-GPD domain-containing protein n=1 Tax=Panagrolaimus sp. JU765 TaxID=591449 RepID=A0AC34REJ8_9BILA
MNKTEFKNKLLNLINVVKNDPVCSEAPVFKYGAFAIPTTSEVDSKLYRLQSFFAAKMSPRSQDQVTFRTCRAIFEAFQPFTITRLSQVSENEWLQQLTKTGHGMSKKHAKQLVSCIKSMNQNFDGDVPRTYPDMLTLEGVGPKVANLLMDLCWNQQKMVVDTHCVRVGNRIGIHSCKNPETTLKFMEENADPSLFRDLNITMVALGQKYCKAGNPKCSECPMAPYCKYALQKANGTADIEDLAEIRTSKAVKRKSGD